MDPAAPIITQAYGGDKYNMKFSSITADKIQNFYSFKAPKVKPTVEKQIITKTEALNVEEDDIGSYTEPVIIPIVKPFCQEEVLLKTSS